MRVVRVMGKAEDGGRPTDWAPFTIQRILTTPDTATPGNLAILNPLAPPGFQLHSTCIDIQRAVKLWGRQRKWQFQYLFSGTYEAADGSAIPFSFTNDTLFVDVKNPAFDMNEQFLPHLRCKFGKDTDIVTSGSETIVYDVNFRELGSAVADEFMNLGNTIKPNIYDLDGSGNRMRPFLQYCPANFAWYLDYRASVDIDILFGLTTAYSFGWRSGTPQHWGMDPDAPDIVPGGAMALDPFESQDGFYFGPRVAGSPTDLYTVSWTLDHLLSVSPGFDSFFEFRDLDGNNPCWDKNTGVQLIDPLPMEMPENPP